MWNVIFLILALKVFLEITSVCFLSVFHKTHINVPQPARYSIDKKYINKRTKNLRKEKINQEKERLNQEKIKESKLELER